MKKKVFGTVTTETREIPVKVTVGIEKPPPAKGQYVKRETRRRIVADVGRSLDRLDGYLVKTSDTSEALSDLYTQHGQLLKDGADMATMMDELLGTIERVRDFILRERRRVSEKGGA